MEDTNGINESDIQRAEKQAELEFQKAKAKFYRNCFMFFSEKKFLMLLTVMFFSTVMKGVGYLDGGSYEKLLMTAIGTAFLDDGLDNFTNKDTHLL